VRTLRATLRGISSSRTACSSPPAARGVAVGPWDVSEVGGREAEVIDFEGLRVPCGPGIAFELNSLVFGGLVEVVVKNGV
jgi:hypothetical protein